MVRHEHLFRFVRVESAVCEPCDRPRPRPSCPTLALAVELSVRPVSARAALYARPWSEMAREARPLCQVVTAAHASRSRVDQPEDTPCSHQKRSRGLSADYFGPMATTSPICRFRSQIARSRSCCGIPACSNTRAQKPGVSRFILKRPPTPFRRPYDAPLCRVDGNLAGCLRSVLVDRSRFISCKRAKHERWQRRRSVEEMPSDPARSMTEIALALGFSETSSFSAAFRQATGSAPTKYRRALA